MSIGKLGYDYRQDGNFLIRQTCLHCREAFDVHALQNANTMQVAMGLCDACEAVRIYEKAAALSGGRE